MAGLRPYTLTTIQTVSPGNATVSRGGNLTIQVTLGGAPSKNTLLQVRRHQGKSEELPFQLDGTRSSRADANPPDATERRYQVELSGIYKDLEYRVQAGDARSSWYAVSANNPPGLAEWQARVTPPAYTGLAPYELASDSVKLEIPADSAIKLEGQATSPLAEITLLNGQGGPARESISSSSHFSLAFVLDKQVPQLELHDIGGLIGKQTLPITIIRDLPPTISFKDTENQVTAGPKSQIPLPFLAQDDYGIRRSGLERLLTEKSPEQIATAPAAPTSPKQFAARFILDLASFDVNPGDTLRFRLWAEDNGPAPDQRRGHSTTFTVKIATPEGQRQAKKKLLAQTQESILQLVKLQRLNLKRAQYQLVQAQENHPPTASRITQLQIPQKTIRRLAIALQKNQDVLGDLRTTLDGLITHEMSDVLLVLDSIIPALPPQQTDLLQQTTVLQTRIINALDALPEGLKTEQGHQEIVDLLEQLQKLIARQRDTLKATKALATTSAGNSTSLARAQDGLANDLTLFLDQCAYNRDNRSADELSEQIDKATGIIRQEKTYENMLEAAEALEENEPSPAAKKQTTALQSLMKALNILNQWRAEHARKIVQDATKTLEKVKAELEKLDEKQTRIAEVTRDLAKRGVLDDEAKAKLGKMDEEQKSMADMVEKLAQDLYQFPELPVCNELNSKMREIFEDVEQALDSENTPAIEIAVQKEDALLDAIRKTKERVEDVEMWLPDIPDNIVWNMESFDTDEFPDIPLVPLPDELEDIVGELLDQAQSIAQESQDTTGNNLIADMEMGWGVADGPMPSFAAKGKSGNSRPNDNEMTGRSGAGREGQSSGELVENHVKGLEGTKTHARRTQDPFQKGMVTEDEDSTLDARSTGGGKLGGESESIGMFGQAPRRDLHTPAHGNNPQKLRQEAEALYATARLLYLRSGSLGSASSELRNLETRASEQKEFTSLRRNVLRRLSDSHAEISTGAVLAMPVQTISRTGGVNMRDVDLSQLPDNYRKLVGEYYRSLDAETN
jgi:hypothetical protein